ncbi:hypothetical protein [Aquabacterium sp. J223]|uniref:hypothetical protein n=1 Tax=Aquabacterium sp. J223 TaxID=2898431 RepID=UPI0021ADFB57|nr:hypothetical protein [Aquabacterium sp. J223]UUX94453.1 hypothetical protein LRS07_14165 [Aquabacterium sp. J223]
MTTARPFGPTARALLRLLAGWLAVLLLVQGLAAGQALARTGRHLHRPPDIGVAAPPAATHDRLHQAALPHEHDLLDASVLALGTDPADGAGTQSLLAAFAAALPSASALALEPRRHLLRAAPAWAASAPPAAPPRRPPRQG